MDQGWTDVSLRHADKLNPRLLASIHKPQTEKIRKKEIVNPGFFLCFSESPDKQANS